MLSPKKPLQLTWDKFVTHFKRKISSDENLMELENQFLTLMKSSMSIDEYTNTFTDKMEFSLRVIPDKLTKVDRYSKGFPWEYTIPVKQAPTFEATIWAAKFVEGMLKKRTTTRVEVGEKRKAKGINNKNSKTKKFSKSNKKTGSNIEGKCCDQYRKKHFGNCVICFKCKKPGHISTNCLVNGNVCFNCGEEGHMKANCPKVEKPIPRIMPPKPKGRSYQTSLNEVKEKADVASGTFLVNQIPAIIIIDFGAYHSFISHKFGRNVSVSNRLEAVTINLDGNEFHHELLPFELSELDVIISME